MIYAMAIAQIILHIINSWAYRIYYTQPRYNHPPIFWNPISRFIVLSVPLYLFFSLIILSFFITDHPIVFTIYSIVAWVIIVSIFGRKGPTSTDIQGALIGDRHAQMSIIAGAIRGTEIGVDVDIMLSWLKEGIENHDADAAYYLGCCYLKGIWLDKNKQSAIDLWRLAASKGHYAASIGLSEITRTE